MNYRETLLMNFLPFLSSSNYRSLKNLIDTNTKMPSFSVNIQFLEKEISCTFPDKAKIKKSNIYRAKSAPQLQEANPAG